MSILKFRAWDGKKMISPDYITRDGRAWWKENSIPTSSDKIMQFTGLCDKNGGEIYEGDIWRHNDFMAIVVFEFCQWLLKRVQNSPVYSYPYFYSQASEGKIIGNIFENPELLEKAK